jgi:hypothetical protein
MKRNRGLSEVLCLRKKEEFGCWYYDEKLAKVLSWVATSASRFSRLKESG